MNFANYQHETSRTLARKPLASYTPEELRMKLAVMGLGITGEAGEVADLLKKHLGHGHNGLSLGDVATTNVAKLRLRYPDGFSEEASKARKDVAP